VTVSLIFSGPMVEPTPSPLGGALEEHMEAAYYKRFLRDNKNLGPVVDSYIKGTGPRPSEDLLGDNHYARGLVLTEDGRRIHG
jgi:hypothetical protein